MFSKKLFSQRLLQLRIAKNVLQSDVAKPLGIGRSAVTLLETGQRSPSIEVFCAILDYFQVPAAFLLNEEPFTHWEELMAHKETLDKAMADLTNLSLADIQSASLAFYVSLFDSLFSRARWNHWRCGRCTCRS